MLKLNKILSNKQFYLEITAIFTLGGRKIEVSINGVYRIKITIHAGTVLLSSFA